MIQLQLGHPKIIDHGQIEIEKVNDAFLKLFHTNEESCFLFWDGIPIRFRYREDFYHCFNEILAMCWMLEKEKEGKTKATLTNQVMKITLKLFWKDDRLEIDALFEAHEELYSKYVEVLNTKNSITISKQSFLFEWNTLLKQFIEVLQQGEVTIKQDTENRKLELLKQVENSIKGYGKLYVNA
ncbi:hypothetical protein [Aquimarina brevivitae]|uniref:Uncharacterized protein n=1 Tax=Aquimarina brevivitae TaxID=323412 RepID=A0A4Q7NZ13_9FLAO|nr:hypothetical protein [Aquimarina brevivitae]RZS92497.1 hypothetical protein EV197_2635 [Aquimarina brevivitae]